MELIRRPGLHDHHIHILALAAARASVDLDRLDVPFADALRAAAQQGPVRAVGYHERIAGPLDRNALDALVPDVPVRVQHRTGELWILNTAALERIPSDPRVEPKGLVWRGDDLVRDSDLSVETVKAVGAELASYGITAVTDASASNDPSSMALLRALPQRVRVMGPLDLDTPGEVKVLLDDNDLPPFDDTCALVRAAHAKGRGVAVHCVTLVQLRFAIALFQEAGVQGDRIEHASVAPPDAITDLAHLGLVVVTQPAFVSARGDDYLTDVDPRDVDALYPIGSLLAAGITVRGSSDAPYGPVDPWLAMRAATDRRTESGAVLSPGERISPAQARALFEVDDDYVLMADDEVVVTVVGGEVVYDAR